MARYDALYVTCPRCGKRKRVGLYCVATDVCREFMQAEQEARIGRRRDPKRTRPSKREAQLAAAQAFGAFLDGESPSAVRSHSAPLAAMF